MVASTSGHDTLVFVLKVRKILSRHGFSRGSLCLVANLRVNLLVSFLSFCTEFCILFCMRTSLLFAYLLV